MRVNFQNYPFFWVNPLFKTNYSTSQSDNPPTSQLKIYIVLHIANKNTAGVAVVSSTKVSVQNHNLANAKSRCD